MTSTSPNPWMPEFVFGFAEDHGQARALAEAVGAQYGEIRIHAFPDGESLVTVPLPNIHGRRIAVCRSLNDPNAKLVELLLAASVLNNAQPAESTLVAPYLAYMRQDKAFHSGEAVSQHVMGQLLAHAFDRFITVDPHLHRTLSLSAVFDGKPALALSAVEVIAAHLRRTVSPNTVIVGPDEESTPAVRALATALRCRWGAARKERQGDRDVKVMLPPDLALTDLPAVILDDVISSGETIVAAVAAAKAAGAAKIGVYTTHALFDQHAALAMRSAGADTVISCDTIPHPSNGISIVPIISAAMRGYYGG